jgi:hypothetical protein
MIRLITSAIKAGGISWFKNMLEGMVYPRVMRHVLVFSRYSQNGSPLASSKDISDIGVYVIMIENETWEQKCLRKSYLHETPVMQLIANNSLEIEQRIVLDENFFR